MINIYKVHEKERAINSGSNITRCNSKNFTVVSNTALL